MFWGLDGSSMYRSVKISQELKCLCKEHLDTQVKITRWLKLISAPCNGNSTDSPEALHLPVFFQDSFLALISIANTFCCVKARELFVFLCSIHPVSLEGKNSLRMCRHTHC